MSTKHGFRNKRVKVVMVSRTLAIQLEVFDGIWGVMRLQGGSGQAMAQPTCVILNGSISMAQNAEPPQFPAGIL